MLKIDVQENPDSTTLTLAGKLTGAWVEEFEKLWRTSIAPHQPGSLVVDLCGVSFIDSRGAELLGLMSEEGADLRASGPLTKYIVEKLTRRKRTLPDKGDPSCMR